MKKIINQFGPILILLGLGLVMLSGHLSKPFYGHHDFNSVYYSTMARNYLRYGLAATKLGQVTNSGLTTPDQFHWHTHHPSLLPLLLAADYRFLGESETAGRLLPLSFSLLSLLLLYGITRELKLSRLAGLASGLLVLTPMLKYFASLPVHEPLVITVSLASLWFYLKNQFSGLYFVTLINGLLAWPGYFLYPLLTVHAWVTNRRQWRKTGLTLVILAGSLGLHLAHIYWLTGDALGGGLFKALLFRLNLTAGSSGPDLVGFTWKKYLIQEARWLTVYYTRPIMLMGGGLLALLVRKWWKQQSLLKGETILLVLFAFGLSYPLVFANIVFIHDYFNIFFYPFLGLTAAYWWQKIDQLSRPVALASLLLLALIVGRERRQFLAALVNSNMHQTGYQLGQLIRSVVPPGEKAVVFSINYADHHGVFINYYADREISYQGYGSDGWSDFLNIYPETTHAFTVLDHRLDNGLIDKALATQAAELRNFGNFNYYRLYQDVKID